MSWALCALSALAPAVAAADSKSECVQAYESSQVLRREARLLEARKALQLCTREDCPGLVRNDCGNWLGEVERALPSVIVQATGDGQQLTDVTVTMDGDIVKNGLDGKAIDVDPGTHKFRYEASGFPPIETTVVVSEGEHYRPLIVAFRRPFVAPVPVRTQRPVPLAVWILGGASVLAAGSFAAWAIAGNQRKTELERQCAPFCSSSDVDGVQHRYLAADISLGVGVVALGAASLLYVTRPEVPVRVGFAAPPSPSAARVLAVDVSGDF
jgi:hypothetical protein